MIFFEIAVPNISITDYLYFLPLILSQDFNQLPPSLERDCKDTHLFRFTKFFDNFFKISPFDAIIPIFEVL
jgi:hypothetical protein